MAAYIIGIILAIIVLIIIGLILRKRVYDEVDRQESWKMDIMNRNIASELAKIKKLTLSGETQDRFETWKERWDAIVTKELPDIEEYLFDAEEAADRYRFPTAKKTLRKIDQIMTAIEADIERILNELDELLESEKTSRLEIEQIQPAIRDLRKTISQNRYQYGKAEIRFEVELDELDEQLQAYDETVKAGNYIEAKEIVKHLSDRLHTLEQEIHEFPQLYKACKQELPAQLDDLYTGMKEMKESGYRIEHLGFEKEIKQYQERLIDCVKALEKGETEESKSIIDELDDRIKEMYQLLEKEAIAKSYIETQLPSYQNALTEISATFEETRLEVEHLKQTYFFTDQDMEKYLSLDKTISTLKNQLEELKEANETEHTAHSEIRIQLESGYEQLEKIENKHTGFKEMIHNLRKDELEAKSQLKLIREQIQVTQRKLNKSNIPGVPSFIWNMMDEASDKNNRVLKALEKQPLDMAEVQQALTESQAAIDYMGEQTDLLLDQAYLTEQVIQYANRYRSKYPLLAAKLAESERLFRAYEYELALEQAAKAIEEIEPGALKRIEEQQMAING
ncbi:MULTISPECIES: septation ring formation regulator EzrA [unclassified Virgibacillus]|uniref:septation ring formation regulator EzrA n=1 Tax=unclassified Virgibacillus TaxID=2620237 RepID=UPI0024DED3BA|nr:septation ring formation regulator EzrA [Virgibacillus sp. LDC-1]